MKDNEGNLWIGTYGSGLMKYDGKTYTYYTQKDGLSHNYIHSMLNAGADAITKFPAIKLFNTTHAKNIENEINLANYELKGTFTKLPEIDFSEINKLNFDQELKIQIIRKIKEYLKTMEGN